VHRKSTLSLAFLLLTAILLPFAAMPAVASAEIDVVLSSQHEQMVPGGATNISVTVTNDNVMNTRSFDISLDATYLPPSWNVTLADTTLGPVFPTQSDSTILIVRLDANAPLGDNGQVDIIVTRSDDANESTTVTLQLSVAPLFLPSLDIGMVGNQGLMTLEPNQTVDLAVPVINNGNVDDTIILQVDETIDLASFWSNYNSSQSNNSGNNTGNNTGGNNSGNNTGNNTGGNNSGNNTGNNTGGNNSGNNTGGNNGSNGTSMKGPSRDVPTDWEVRWLDPLAVNMSAGESRNHTLRISVPPDASPQYLGVALFAGSVGGNFSIQSVIVIEVSTMSDIAVSVEHDANRTYLPGVTEVVAIDITNNGNDETTLLYSTSTDSFCDATFTTTLGGELTPLASESLSMNITPDYSTHWNDTCNIHIFAEESNTGVIHESIYTIVVGVDWGWQITPPEGTVLDAGVIETIQIGVRNIGSELDEVRFELVGPSGITASGPPSWVTIDRGLSNVVSFQVEVDGSTTMVGLHNLTLTATGLHGGEQEVVSVPVTIAPRTALDLVSPQGGNVLVEAGDSTNFSIQATNDGTSALSFDIDWSGLPSSLSFANVLDTSTVEVGETLVIPITVSAAGSAAAVTHQVTIYAKTTNSSEILAQTSFSIEVAHSPSVKILASSDTLPVGENALSSMDFVILNDGNQQDQFSFALSPSSDGFEVTITPLLITLDAGAQDVVTVTMRRTTATGEAPLALVATSSNDAAVSDTYDFTVTEVTLGVTAALTSTDKSAMVGQIIQAYFWLTNTGNANQTFQLSTSGLDCSNLQSTITLAPSPSATPVLVECLVAQNTAAGVVTLSATATSLADPAVSASGAINLTIPEDRENGQPRLTVTVTGSGDNVLPHAGSLVLTVNLKNEGNEDLSGTLSVVGEGAADLSPGWTAIGGSSSPSYNLGPGDEVTYELMLVSTFATSGGELSMRVQAAGSGHQLLSSPFSVNVAGPTVAPDGVSFGFFELDNQTSITVMSVGWLCTILFVLMTISRRKRAKKNHIRSTFFETEETMPDLPAPIDLPPPPVVAVTDLASDEARMVDGRVSCPSCSSSLKMPDGREAPFKFTCPKCKDSVRVVD
jgi:uncharacterized membrane protein